jgi:hypothetical protein
MLSQCKQMLGSSSDSVGRSGELPAAPSSQWRHIRLEPSRNEEDQPNGYDPLLKGLPAQPFEGGVRQALVGVIEDEGCRQVTMCVDLALNGPQICFDRRHCIRPSHEA